MQKIFLVTVLLFVAFVGGQAQQLAFPTAEGFGKYTSGGRGGKVYTVTNLNDSGEGSLRFAIEQKGARTVVFAVDGTIELKSKLIIHNDSITITGQTAPGDGICLRNYPFYVRANNVIIRYIRSRMDDQTQAEDDAMGAMDVKNLIIDHCSISWSTDECLSVYRSSDLTVQWCMITHSLANSVHSKGRHGFGGIWGGERATFHHNLLAHNTSRNPRFASDGCSPVDYRNNVVYNWGFKSAYGGGRYGRVNFIANYYKPGPATSTEVRERFLDPAEDETGSYFLADNIMESSDAVTLDNWLGVSAKKCTKAELPFEVVPINQDDANISYIRVLNSAGASLKRDVYDQRIIEEVKTGTAEGGESYGANTGIIDSQDSLGGWPTLRSKPAYKDSDQDGIPDYWEELHDLDPKDPTDGSLYSLSNEYTNLEVYMNSLVH